MRQTSLNFVIVTLLAFTARLPAAENPKQDSSGAVS